MLALIEIHWNNLQPFLIIGAITYYYDLSLFIKKLNEKKTTKK